MSLARHLKRCAAALPARDVARARKFYESTLGLVPVDEMPDGGAFYMLGGSLFAVFSSVGQPSGTHTQLAFEVDDVEAAAAEFRQAGVALEEYDYGTMRTVNGVMDLPDGTKGAWFKDTEGNLMALRQRPMPRAAEDAGRG